MLLCITCMQNAFNGIPGGGDGGANIGGGGGGIGGDGIIN